MKYLASLFMLVLNISLTAQYYNGIHKLHYTSSGGEMGVSTYIYNGRETPYKAIWELEDSSRWSENYHEFDKQGRLTGKYREFSDSITSRQEFIYNEQGELVRESFARSDGIKGHVDYVYADGKCLRAKCKGLNGWFFGEIHNHYGKNGVKDSSTLVMEGKRAGRILYSYNPLGQTLKEVWEFNSGFSQTFLYEYIDTACIRFRSSNVFIPPSGSKVVQEEHYNYNDQGGGPSGYTYDENKRLLKKTFNRNDGLKTTTTYTYHENGLLKESVRHYNNGDTGTFTYIYDDFRQLIRRCFVKSDGKSGLEEYSYDQYGRLVSGSYLNFDGWLTGTLEFSHDRYDRLSSAKYKGENGLHATIRFFYDADNTLIRIHWLFEDGTTQTYQFRY